MQQSLRCYFRTGDEAFAFVVKNIKFRVPGIRKWQRLKIDFRLTVVR